MEAILETPPAVAALVLAALFFLLAIVSRIEWRGARIVLTTWWQRILCALLGLAFLAPFAWTAFAPREPCPPCPPCPPACPESINVTVNLVESTSGPIQEDQFEIPLPFQTPEEPPTPEEFDRYAEIWERLTGEERTTLILNSLKDDTPIWVGPDLSPMFWGNLSEVDRDSFEELLLRSDTRLQLTMPPAICPGL